MGWAAFWASFSQTHLVTLQQHQGDQSGRYFAHWVIVF
jgi:hypothetical protein